MLKALILSGLPPKARQAMVDSFRGNRAHDFEWLKAKYLKGGGPHFPKELFDAFSLVGSWKTDIRYEARMFTMNEARSFLTAAEAIHGWAEERL